MNRFTIAPFLIVFFAGLLDLPALNVFKVCAWNAGVMKVDPWRIRSARAVQKVSSVLRAWFAGLFTRRRAFACGAVLLAVLVAQLAIGHVSATDMLTVVAVTPVAGLRSKRAKLLKEATALKSADGSFADDATREAFDAKMAEIEGLDGQMRGLASSDDASEFIREDNPMRPRARAANANDNAEAEAEPNERDLGADAERSRNNGILDACAAARLPLSFARKLIDEDGLTLLEAQKRVFKELKGKEDPTPAPNGGARRAAEVGDDPFMHTRAGIENALLHRVNPSHFKLEEVGRSYRGMSLLDIARAYLNARGVRTTDMSRMDLAGAALGLTQVRGGIGMHTTSDFSYLLADVASKSLRADYEAAPQTFDPFVRRGTVPDFKASNRVQLGDAPALAPVGEHGEFTRGTMEEGREQVQAATYGRVFGITRKALVNDDTDAFSKVPAKFGRMAKNLESDLVYYQLLKNAAMGDSVALFHATHSNYSGAGDITVNNVGVAERAMLLQRGLDGTTLISAQPKYLLVSPTKKIKAQQFVAAINPAQVSQVNPYAGQLSVIVEPRLEVGVTIGQGGGAMTASGSAYAWYLVSDKNIVDIIELVFLEGQTGPVIESRVGFDIDGLEIKCRHDVGAKVIDYRGLYKNDGSDAS